MESYKQNDTFGIIQYQVEKEFWNNLFRDNFQKTIIRDDYPNVPETEAKLDEFHFSIEGKLFERLNWIANGSDYRLFIILLSNYMTLLKHYSNSDTIVIGTTIYKQEFEADFINTVLPLKIDFQQINTFKELLALVRSRVNDAVQNQNYPMHKLIKDLSLEESKWRYPLFDQVVLLKNIQDENYIVNQNIGIKFLFEHIDSKIDVTIEFDANRYGTDTVLRLKEHYLHLMEFNVNNVDSELRGTTLITPEEKELIKTFNNTDTPLKSYNSIIEWFDDTACRFSAKNALSFVDLNNSEVKYLSYGELHNKVNRLAMHLKKMSVNKNTLVGILCKQDFYRVISILGILKAGAAYVPVDTNLPDARIRFILKDCNCELLVTDENLLNQFDFLKSDFGANKVVLLNQEAVYQEEFNEFINYSKDDLAYIIYTSGSTGQPKGVAVNNLGILNYVAWRFKTYNFTEEDITLQLLSYAFDGYNSNFYTSIISGGELVLMPDYDVLDSEKVLRVIQERKVTNISAIPRIFDVLVNSDQSNSALASLRFIVFAGERAIHTTIEILNRLYPNLKIINEYGPTETTVTITGNTHLTPNEINVIGKPIDNTQILILNKERKFVPPLLTGEIYCTGYGLSRGYLNAPEKTAEVFEFIENHQRPVYKTGDIGFWDKDGRIHLMGRYDDQIKIRGFRIEVEEIISALKKHENISEVTVVAHAISENEKQLHAFYVPKNGKMISNMDKFLELYLPEYMIPVSFTNLTSFPLTLSGKIDKKKLPISLTSNKLFKAPRTTTERKLVEIWMEVLNKPFDQIGIQSNFFEMGGHSLNATFVISKIQKVFNIKIPMVDVFEHPVIEFLAKKIDSKIKESYEPITKASSKEDYPLTQAQKRFFFLQESSKKSTAYNIPVVLKIEGKIDENKVRDAFRALVKRHCSLRTVFQLKGNTTMQKVLPSVSVDVKSFRSLIPDIRKIMEDFVQPFDLKEAPLFRVAIVETEKEKFFLFDMHHIITDAISMQILTHEFMQLYSGHDLPALSVDYIDYTMHRIHESNTHTYKQQKDYWLNYLSGDLPRLNLPIDNERTEELNFSGDNLHFSLARDLSEKLRNLSKTNGVTLFMMTLGIFKVFLYRLTKTADIIIGTPVSGRQHPDVQNIVGLFINTLIIRSQIKEDTLFQDFISNLKSDSLRAFDNQTCDFSEIAESLDTDRSSNRNLIFDVLFVFDNFRFETLKNNDFELVPMDYNTVSSKLDLTLMVLSEQEEMQFIFEYNNQLFERETIQLFKSQFLQILTDICDDPCKRISEYCINYNLSGVLKEEEIDFDL